MVAFIENLFKIVAILVITMGAFYFLMFRPIDSVRDRATELGDITDGNATQIIHSLCVQKNMCRKYKNALNDCALAAHIDDCVKIKEPINAMGKYACDQNGDTLLTKKYADVMGICYVDNFLSGRYFGLTN